MTDRLSNAEITRAAHTIRGLSIDAIQAANSGHPGLPMGMADVAALLWLEYLRYDPSDPNWFGRDRFVLSAGHGSMLQYSLLHLAGFDLPLEELKKFRQLDSKTPGHPEFGHTAGVETTTGPLGQGFGNGVGMGLAGRHLAARFQCPELQGRVFAIVSDGDLMEGISSEAASIAGHLGLGHLTYLYDDNQITIDGSTEIAFSEDIEGRFSSQGWHVERVDGHDLDSIRAGIDAALATTDRPSLVICKTQIGYGSPNKAGSHKVHGAPLGEDEIALTKQALGLPADAFAVEESVRTSFARRASANQAAHQAWTENYQKWRVAHADRATELDAILARTVPSGLLDALLAAVGDDQAATRAHGGKAVQRAAELVPALVGGSADLNASTKTDIKASTAITKSDGTGRNLCFGIREHAMGSLMNGIALYGGLIPLGSTFLVFSDYMRPAVRLAALMKLPCVFVYTHDSLMVGEDGPTHQPVEHAAALRLIPNLEVWRPADGPETAAAWSAALSRRDGPSALLLTRQGLPPTNRPSGFQAQDMLAGAYLALDAENPRGTVLATGAELHVAIDAAKILAERGQPMRVVSVPCAERLRSAPPADRATLLGDDPVFAVEMGRPEMWCEFTRSIERVIGLRRFGKSGPYAEVAEDFGFTATQVAEQLASAL